MAERITESPPPSATDRNGQVITTTTTIIELQQSPSPSPSSPPSPPPPPQITITSPPLPPPTQQQQLFQRHNSIFCFDNAAYEDEEHESDFEVFEDAETAVKVDQQEDEEYAFEPELRFRVGKRSSSLVTFFRSFNPSRGKTVTISEPEMANKEEGEEEVDSRRKSSTKMPPRSSSQEEPPKPQKPRAENQRQNNSHSTSSDFIPKAVPFKAPERWIPFFSLVSFSTKL